MKPLHANISAMLAALALVITSCAKQHGSVENAATAPGAAADTSQRAAPPLREQFATRIGESSDAARRFIVEADARLEVKDVYRSALAIEDAAIAAGGFVASDSIRAESRGSRTVRHDSTQVLELEEYQRQAAITVRVPVAQTQTFLRSLAAQAVFIDSRGYSATDAQFAALRHKLEQARLAQAGEEAERATAHAPSSDARVNAATATAELRLGADDAAVAARELEDRIAYSTIALGLYQAPQLRQTLRADLERAAADARAPLWRRLWLALGEGARGGLDAIVIAVRLWPLWLVLAAVVWGVRRLRRRVRCKPQPS